MQTISSQCTSFREWQVEQFVAHSARGVEVVELSQLLQKMLRPRLQRTPGLILRDQ